MRKPFEEFLRCGDGDQRIYNLTTEQARKLYDRQNVGAVSGTPRNWLGTRPMQAAGIFGLGFGAGIIASIIAYVRLQG